ncbi:hypothetical protein [Streptosporangium sp. NPDC002524]|uniref:hypothetical protein n=1 Tax=Streptosporangium sp. NPDC002524 TaxID=3154537 RepID=UPI00331CC536
MDVFNLYFFDFGGALLGAAAAFFIALAIVRSERQARRRLNAVREDPGEGLRRRIERVNEAFIEAATLMADLQHDLAAQQAAREELIAKAEEQQRLLAIDQETAENIRQILVGETKATIRAEQRQQWKFFLLGALISIPIGIGINVFVP